MLRLRADQYQTMRVTAMDPALTRLAAEVRAKLPDLVATASDEKLKRFCEVGGTKSQSYGITTEYNVYRSLQLCCFLAGILTRIAAFRGPRIFCLTLLLKKITRHGYLNFESPLTKVEASDAGSTRRAGTARPRREWAGRSIRSISGVASRRSSAPPTMPRSARSKVHTASSKIKLAT